MRHVTVARLVLWGLIIICCFSLACTQYHFRVDRRAIQPKDLHVVTNEDAILPVSVQIIDFSINKVDTQWPEKDEFRKHNSVEIPNMIWKDLQDRKVFHRVIRLNSADSESNYYIIGGDYDFFERLTIASFRWEKNISKGKEDMTVWIKKSETGEEIFRNTYTDQHEDQAPMGIKSHYNYLQPAFIARIASDLVNSIESDIKSK